MWGGGEPREGGDDFISGHLEPVNPPGVCADGRYVTYTGEELGAFLQELPGDRRAWGSVVPESWRCVGDVDVPR